MGTCSACGTEFGVQLCPNCGSDAQTRRQINKALVKYSYPAFGGLAGIVIADLFYPMLDRDPLIAGVCLFLVPGLFHVISSARSVWSWMLAEYNAPTFPAERLVFFSRFLWAAMGLLTILPRRLCADPCLQAGRAGKIGAELHAAGAFVACWQGHGRPGRQCLDVPTRFNGKRHCGGNASRDFWFAVV